MKRRKISMVTKLFVIYTIAILFFVFGWSVLGTRFFQNKLIADTKSTFYHTLSKITDKYAQEYYNNSITNADMVTELDIISDYLNCRILCTKNGGSLIYDSGGSSSVNLFSYNTDILSDTYCYNVTLPGFIDEPFLSVSSPVAYNMQLRGYIVFLKPCSEIFSEADDINSSYWPYILLISLLLSVIFILVCVFMVKPVENILKASKEYSNKNFSRKCNIRSFREYKELYNVIQCMADDLSNLNNENRKLISNISHDFRSPLTSIKGYTEALIDGTIPFDMQEKYLNIILFETERLTKLTSDLLELSKIDNKDIILDITPFDVNASIKYTVACFEGVCKHKHLHIILVFEEPKTYVLADLGKIQQVLYNLIDNAIKFSNGSSDITISTTIKNEKIFVSIKDCGIGIPRDSLAKIWDRFYKTDLSRGKDKKGTGLGLSIVKEIINAHNENINVTSTPDVGTEFTFSLPRKPV